MTVYRLSRALVFPPASEADEDGLLAIGGDLRPERVLLAYRSGIFPWPHRRYPLLWFSPDPRTVIVPSNLHVPRRLARKIKTGRFRVSIDRAFREVIRRCADAPRPTGPGTWITSGIMEAFGKLHDAGHVHSVEAWTDDELAGGLYGVAVGGVFVGESMFARIPDASKVALVTLVRQISRWGFSLFDAQIRSEHVVRFGAEDWPRSRYLAVLGSSLAARRRAGPWRIDDDLADGAAFRHDDGMRRADL